MKVMCKGHVRKISLCNKKTKIYQTIKGLIILIINLQFSIRCNQAFRPLRTSTFNVYLNIYLYLNCLVTCIISDAFVSSSICLMTPNIHIAEISIYPIKVRSRLMYLSGLRATSQTTRRSLSFSSLLWCFWRQSWHPHKGEVLAVFSLVYIYTTTKRYLRVIYLTLWQVDDLQEG